MPVGPSLRVACDRSHAGGRAAGREHWMAVFWPRAERLLSAGKTSKADTGVRKRFGSSRP